MKNSKDNLNDVDATHERTSSENEKLRRNQEERTKGMESDKDDPKTYASGLNEKEDADEMEDLYQDEEDRGKKEAE